MRIKLIIKNNAWIDKLYCIFFLRVLQFLLRTVKLFLFLFCFSASINIQSGSKRLTEPFSVAFSEEEKEKAQKQKEIAEIEENISKIIRKIKIGERSGYGFFIKEVVMVTTAQLAGESKDLKVIKIVEKGKQTELQVQKIALSEKTNTALLFLKMDGVVSDLLDLPEKLSKPKLYFANLPNSRNIAMKLNQVRSQIFV